ncbi:MAG: DUF559 domain-containing protein [Clostridia bacterium]|nr:DUF559 domain-containing protein [Clostridia bacterium]
MADNKKYFTFTDEEDLEAEEVKPYLAKKVLDALEWETSWLESDLIHSMVDCQSPIEQLMALYLCHIGNSYRVISKEVKLDLNILGYISQSEIKIGNKTYSVDFEACVCDNKTNEYKSFVIECDGHDFHEKTKEQVRKDKERERDLIKSGRTVIRFSGSEIYRDASGCASEVFNIIFKHFERR